MEQKKIALVGYGAMGKRIAAAIQAHEGWELCGVIDPLNEECLSSLSLLPEKPHVVIDFSHPANLEMILSYCREQEVACVLSTTGFSPAQEAMCRELSAYVPVVRTQNTSLGINILEEILRTITPILKDRFDIEIIEKHHNRKLDAPRGDGTRPTTDRVRESLMSALVSLRDGLDGAVVLDAFAGSGALSLEALSRGADTAMLCERDRDAAAVIERNIAALRLGRDRARLVRGDVLKRGAAAPGRPFDLIFLDPPYATDPAEVFGLLSRLDAADALAADLIVSYEHDASDDDAVETLAETSGYEIASRRHFGDTTLDLLERLCTE